WELEEQGTDLILVPALIGVAGARIHSRPVADLPLIHVEYPEFTGSRYFLKRAFDLLVTSAIVAVLSPILLILALLVRFSGPGPIIFKQTRVGIDGSTFTMLKFRSMVADAEQQLVELRDQSEGNEV